MPTDQVLARSHLTWRFDLHMESSMKARSDVPVPGSSVEARRPVCYCLWNFAFSASTRC